jgi:hypothetical protein
MRVLVYNWVGLFLRVLRLLTSVFVFFRCFVVFTAVYVGHAHSWGFLGFALGRICLLFWPLFGLLEVFLFGLRAVTV